MGRWKQRLDSKKEIEDLNFRKQNGKIHGVLNTCEFQLNEWKGERS